MRDGAEGSLTFEYTNTGRVSRVTDMEGAVTDYEYDVLGRLVRVSGALGSGAAFTYDGTGISRGTRIRPRGTCCR